MYVGQAVRSHPHSKTKLRKYAAEKFAHPLNLVAVALAVKAAFAERPAKRHKGIGKNTMFTEAVNNFVDN